MPSKVAKEKSKNLTAVDDKIELSKGSVGKIAERIVMNELEARGFRVTDLNKDGLSANADLIAARDGATFQIQVKGATNKAKERWWVQYGHCTEEVIDEKKKMFNQKDSFYFADYVVLVAVKSPSDYRCFVLPQKIAEDAAQMNLDRYYRQPKVRDEGKRKPGKVWVYIEKSPRERSDDRVLKKERSTLQKFEGKWDVLQPLRAR